MVKKYRNRSQNLLKYKLFKLILPALVGGLTGLAAIRVGAQTVDAIPIHAPKYIEVHGHRGAREMYSEASLMGFRKAIEMGADYIEMDLRVTQDGVVIIHHDVFLNENTCVDRTGQRVQGRHYIHQMTWKEVQEYDCAGIAHPEFPHQIPVHGQHIPSLADMIAMVKSYPNSPIRMHIELKSYPKNTIPKPDVFAQMVVPMLKKEGVLDRVVFEAFVPAYAKAADTLADKLGRAKPPKIISPPDWIITADRIKAFHTKGFKVIPFTVNDVNDLQSMIDKGADGIITDATVTMIERLKALGYR